MKNEEKIAIKIVFKISGLRKYLCHLCDKTFQNSRQLKDHIQVVHEGIKYGCERCDKTFNSLNRMRDHIKFTHEDRPFMVYVHHSPHFQMNYLVFYG